MGVKNRTESHLCWSLFFIHRTEICKIGRICSKQGDFPTCCVISSFSDQLKLLTSHHISTYWPQALFTRVGFDVEISVDSVPKSMSDTTTVHHYGGVDGVSTTQYTCSEEFLLWSLAAGKKNQLRK